MTNVMTTFHCDPSALLATWTEFKTEHAETSTASFAATKAGPGSAAAAAKH